MSDRVSGTLEAGSDRWPEGELERLSGDIDLVGRVRAASDLEAMRLPTGRDP
jgi:hypothetical protein